MLDCTNADIFWRLYYMYMFDVRYKKYVTKSGNIAYPCVVCCVIDDGKGKGDLLGSEEIMQRTSYLHCILKHFTTMY